ncbi:MAG: DUF4139 domain-containing protein [Armatimonadota bacterium]|nr:MAG: DUF4139 domain-containing protein [Armatimonadota bacterium]
MKKASTCLLGAFLLLASSIAALAGEPPVSAPVQTHLKRVALFKNGLGFFVREAALPADTNLILIGPFAAPSHGTFWVSCPARAGLRSVTARQITVSEGTPAITVAELLRANIGRTATLYTGTDPEAAFTGEIIAFAPGRTPEPPAPYAMGQRVETGRVLPPGRGQFLLLKTDDGVCALDPYRISSVRFAEAEIERSFTRDSQQIELDANFTSPTAGDWLSVSYLAKGITWAPSYLIDISDPKHARLTAKALILNEAEDIEAAHVDLITGFPNLQFADVLSPVSSKESLAAFLRALSQGRSAAAEATVMSNVMTQRAEFAWGAQAVGGPAARQPVPAYGAAAAGQVAEDLFLYPLEDVTLAKNETGYYPLFTETVPYTEFYHWEIPDYVTEEDRYGQRRREERDKLEEVWHSLRLTNTTELPWTTAPAQLMKDGGIIGQDTLNYTPPKAKATVKITQAVSVKAEQAEVEIERERDAVRLYGYHYDRVTIKGTLSVTNFKDEKISLEITKTLSGEVESTIPQAKDIALARGLARMNPTHLLTWTLDLKAGEHREITYTYQALIRR